MVEGISLASKSRDTSAWQFVETKKGYLVRAAAGKYKGWYIVVDDSAKTRPEGPTLTVTPALRLAKRPPANSHWTPLPANIRASFGILVVAIHPTRRAIAKLPSTSYWPKKW